jgi:hypothetical protein
MSMAGIMPLLAGVVSRFRIPHTRLSSSAVDSEVAAEPSGHDHGIGEHCTDRTKVEEA